MGFLSLLRPSRFNKLPILAILSISLLLFYLTQITHVNLRSDNKYINIYHDSELQRLQDEEWLFPYFEKIPFHGEIIVHFDFKGAPPKVSYLLDIIPLIRKLGATGVLLEYEDMFPYHDGLEDIKAQNAYSVSDVAEIVEAAERNNLSVIPLVQTFSHLEFVLKLEKYKDFREVEQFPQILCPSHKEVHVVLEKMISQVLNAHPRAKYFHVGCDEAHYVGICPKCLRIIKKNKWRKDDLYFNHVRKIAKYIIKSHPGVRPIIWGDKFQKQNEKTILKHEIPKLLDVMFWNYKSDRNTFPETKDMKSYARLFKNIWIASAFKGATGSTQIVTNPQYHIRNTKAWIQIVSEWKKKINFKGIALTGWQRYGHFSVLCDLLPVAIPSLAVNLESINAKKDFDYDEVKHMLNCNDYLPLNMQDIRDSSHLSKLKCDFPGYAVYQIIHLFYNEKQNIKLLLNGLRTGDMSFYNIVHNMSNPAYVQILKDRDYQKYLGRLTDMEKKIRISMAKIYDEHTVDEWIMTHVMPLQLSLEAAISVINTLSRQTVWPRRPFRHDADSLRKSFRQVCGPTETNGCPFFHLY